MNRYFKKIASNHIICVNEGREGVKSGSLLDRTINSPKFVECDNMGVILDMPKKVSKSKKKSKKGKK
ncbi:MAG: hypothetical protein Unbinned4311contig1001_15 [Prokaryotic dsDNA virus sp.]|nr:MAG: hypothetical protein Unbinned4311contig1001_15 [Prokaryotic dsDNA virus sp.]|tara:strand:+ start:1167 stop:1367 length:201 start_codon:yes stop_codon:yes gene_type:complete